MTWARLGQIHATTHVIPDKRTHEHVVFRSKPEAPGGGEDECAAVCS